MSLSIITLCIGITFVQQFSLILLTRTMCIYMNDNLFQTNGPVRLNKLLKNCDYFKNYTQESVKKLNNNIFSHIHAYVIFSHTNYKVKSI